jgi:hypothetical protein
VQSEQELWQRTVDLLLGRLAHAAAPNRTNHTNHKYRDVFHHALSDWILARPVAASRHFIDDHNRSGIDSVAAVEPTPGSERDAHHTEIVRRDAVGLDIVRFLGGGLAFGHEVDSRRNAAQR